MIPDSEYDYVIVGSGFGGSVSALRMAEKGYKVLVIEKGKWFREVNDFPKTNWQLSKWLWLPILRWKGLFNLSFFRHVTVVSGTGVGGGSLVYANTLPIPKKPFFTSGSWKDLADWEHELKPFYTIAQNMLGAAIHPYSSQSDKVIETLAQQTNKEHQYQKTSVAVYFGKPGEEVNDPYFQGNGPTRTGCTSCGGCMLGCRYNAKNTLDKNYLYLAQKYRCDILAENEVTDIIPQGLNGSAGYEVVCKNTYSFWGKKKKIKTKGIIMSAGVLGTLDLLNKLKRTTLPALSATLGHQVRTNSESLIGITSFKKNADFSQGIAIGSILAWDDDRNLEPVSYPAGSGFWRLFMTPLVKGSSFFVRFPNMLFDLIKNPVQNVKALCIDDWSKRTIILLYMESIDSTLKFTRNIFGRLASRMDRGNAPSSYNPVAFEAAKKIEKIVDGKAMAMSTETLFGIPTTAHILGGAVMGKNEKEGVIDSRNQVFNYDNFYICDGSMISANIGVNPSLTITAITERAMSFIPSKS